MNVSRETLELVLGLLKSGSFATGVCMCGGYVKDHGYDGHSAVDDGEYYAGNVIEQLEKEMES